jgi:hypothetical protein
MRNEDEPTDDVQLDTLDEEPSTHVTETGDTLSDPPKLPIVGRILKRIDKEEAIAEREEQIEDELVEPVPQRTTFKLCTFENTPEFLRRPYITNHYRVYFSFNLAFARYVPFTTTNTNSLFKLHNETFNVWTHLIGFFIFVGLLIYTIIVFSVGYGTGSFLVGDLIVMVVYCLLAINCFLSSSCYHLFNCKSAKAWHMCYKCDLSAISGLIGGSFIPALYYNLYCDQIFQYAYFSLY